MADQHNANIPAVGNQITADVADIKENLEFHKDVFENFLDNWSDTDATAGRWLPPNAYYSRPIFTYNGASAAYTIKVGGGECLCKDKNCFWNEELTTAAIGSPSGSTWYYLYLDYSGITSGTAITNTELAWSSTAPTYNHQYKGWYNGDDRCICAVLTNSTPDNIIEFYHDGGDFIQYASAVEDMSGDDIDTTYTAQALTIPVFGDNARALVTMRAYAGSVSPASCFWRKGGSSANGHEFGRVSNSSVFASNTIPVNVDSSQQIEVKFDAGGNNTIYIFTNGYYLPRGM